VTGFASGEAWRRMATLMVLVAVAMMISLNLSRALFQRLLLFLQTSFDPVREALSLLFLRTTIRQKAEPGRIELMRLQPQRE
jgi:hypothetical protein